MEIDVIGQQKQNIILAMLQLACYNPEINWRIGKVKMTRCSEECKKQQKPKQEKAKVERKRWKETKRKRIEKEKEKK